MPTYQYQCDGCDYLFEVFQSMTENSKKKCPSCKKMKLEKLISGGAGVVFKGSGFYETDYKVKSGKPEEKKESTLDSKPKKDTEKKKKSSE